MLCLHLTDGCVKASLLLAVLHLVRSPLLSQLLNVVLMCAPLRLHGSNANSLLLNDRLKLQQSIDVLLRRGQLVPASVQSILQLVVHRSELLHLETSIPALRLHQRDLFGLLYHKRLQRQKLVDLLPRLFEVSHSRCVLRQESTVLLLGLTQTCLRCIPLLGNPCHRRWICLPTGWNGITNARSLTQQIILCLRSQRCRGNILLRVLSNRADLVAAGAGRGCIRSRLQALR
mmetsp:Transcript_9525/g.24287  ORF Transcript_9525/g.24287 Transcript_9525/m.24287 type:complete len:231 (+) Transcript_9525:4968-5660(+)